MPNRDLWKDSSQDSRGAISDPPHISSKEIPEGKYRVQLLPGLYPLSDHLRVGFGEPLMMRQNGHLVCWKGLSLYVRNSVAICTGIPKSTSLLSSAFPSLLSQRVFPYISAMVNNGSLSYDHERDGRPTELGGCTAIVRNLHYDTFLVIRYVKRHLTVSPCFLDQLVVWSALHLLSWP